MTDDSPPGSQLEQWISIGATVVAPVTVIGALLFYFGYVSSASEYSYFGIDVDTIGLSTQDYVMRSPQTLLVPLLVLTLAGAGFLTLNTEVRRRINAAAAAVTAPAKAGAPDTDPAKRSEHIWHLARRSRACGLAMLAAGVLLLFIYGYVRDWGFYGLVTPLLIGFGAALTAYASHVLTLIERLRENALAAVRDAGPGRPGPGLANSPVLARRTAAVLIAIVIAASVLWATATTAQWTGRGLALYQASNFNTLPSLILDTKERLFLRDPGIEETVLPPSAGQTFHYRYRGLRLLIEGQNRMFLVPDQWSASDSTLVVPLDGSVRVQFQFLNEPP